MSKKTAYVCLVVLVFTVFVVGYFLITYNQKNNKNLNSDVGQSEELEKQQLQLDSFEKSVDSFRSGDYESSKKSSLSIAQDGSYGITERLQSYGTCIVAAREVKDEVTMTLCFKEGKKLADSLTNKQDIDLWYGVLSNNFNGNSNNGEVSSGDLQ